MSNVIRVLHQEHTNLGKLLKVLERRVAALGSAEASDLELIRDVLEYCLHYPSEVHHPKEDQVLAALRARDPKAAEPVKDLEAEHEELKRLTVDVAAKIDNALSDAPVSKDDIREAAAAFIETYWRHMTMEEDEFFPIALKTLTDEDWQAIDAKISDPVDPLFSEQAADKYARLRYEIFKADAAS